MRSFVSVALLGLGAVCLAVVGCGDDKTSTPDEVGAPQISDRVFNLEERPDVILAGAGDSTYTFVFTGPSRGLEVGDIIVGTEPEGYLRRVAAIDSNLGTYTVGTTWAALTDAVIAGAVDTTLHLDLGALTRRQSEGGGARFVGVVNVAPGVQVQGDHLELAGVSLFSGEVNGVAVAVTIRQALIEFNPELALDLVVRDSQVREFAAVGQGNLSFDCDARAEASGEVAHAGETVLASFTYAATQMIGHFPVTERITLSFIGEFELAAGGAGACEFGCDSDISLSAGARYKNGGWSRVWMQTADLGGGPVEWNASSSLEARVCVKPRIDVAFYSAGGPRIEVAPFVSAQCEFGGAPPCSWRLSGGISGALDFHTGILGSGLGGYSRQIDEYEGTIAGSGGSCACTWSKYEGNPVLTVGPASHHDDKQAHVSCVIKVGSEYWMYYYGSPTWSTNSKYIMLATSPDGITWTKYGTGNQPLDFGDAPGAPGYVEIMGISVLYDPETSPPFQAWFGKAQTDVYCPIDIYYATSDDGITWEKRPGAVLRHDGSGWESYRVQWPCVMKVGGLYHMWYEGHPEAAPGGVGHATSPDGVTWTRDPANPVIEPERNAPWVVLKDGVYHMYISAWEGFLSATSSDGVVWDTSNFSTYVLGRGSYGGWEGVGVERMAALVDGGILKCWYSAGDADAWRTGYASCLLTPLGCAQR